MGCDVHVPCSVGPATCAVEDVVFSRALVLVTLVNFVDAFHCVVGVKWLFPLWKSGIVGHRETASRTQGCTLKNSICSCDVVSFPCLLVPSCRCWPAAPCVVKRPGGYLSNLLP